MNKLILNQLALTWLLIIIVKISSGQILIALVFGDKLNNDKLEFGMNVGINTSSISNVDYSQHQIGLNLGLNFVYKINDKFNLNPALYFSYPLGAKKVALYETPDSNLNELLKDATLERKLSYFSLPVTIGYRLFGLTYIDVGPQFGLNSSAKDIFEVTMFENDEVIYTQDVKKNYKWLDAGLTIGITQKLKEKNGISLKLRYYYGLVDISKNPEEPNQHNSSFYFSAAIPIGGTKNIEKKPKE